MKVKLVQLVLPAADIIGREMRVVVNQRAPDPLEKITGVDENDLEAISWSRPMSSGKKFKGSREEKEGSVKQPSENQVQ